MTAGRGIVHSELPEQQAGRMEGFQLWLNLPAADKMRPAWYRDIQADEIPQYVTEQGATVRVIAGTSGGIAGAMQREVTEPLYLDLQLPAGARFAQAVPPDFNVFAYVYRGEVMAGERSVPAQRMAVFRNDADSDGVELQAVSDARLLLIAGRPLRESIVQYGPFVMNTQEQIFAAINDYREGRF